MKITSRKEFKDYCMRALGWPVIEVNLSDEQLNDRIDDAIYKFQNYHMSGSEKTYIRVKVTQQDIDNRYIDMSRGRLGGTITTTDGSKTVTGTGTIFRLDTYMGETLAVIYDGMLTTKDRSPIVTGYNTDFVTDVEVGDMLLYHNAKEIGIVKSIESTTSLTLTTNAKQVVEDVEVLCLIGVIDEQHSDTNMTLRTRAKKVVTNVANAAAIRDAGMLSVSRIFPAGQLSTGLFSARYQFMIHDINNFTMGGLQHYAMTRAYTNMVQMLMEGEKPIRFNQYSNKLYVDMSWDDIIHVDDYIVAEGFRPITPEFAPELWNDEWLKLYATALIKQNWGSSMKKFQGVKLPGGIVLDGQKIYDEATEAIKGLELKLQQEFEFPAGMFVG